MLRWVIAAAFLAAAVVTGWRSIAAARKVRAARGWTRVSATIIESRVETIRTYDADHRPVTIHAPRIAYAYEAQGRRHTGRQLGLSEESFLDAARAQARVGAYPEGARVDALVDPADPGHACLAAKAEFDVIAPIAFLLLAAVTASGVMGG